MATRFLGLATLLLIASILVLEISAQTECGGDISAIETQCRSFYEKEGPQIPPSDACCDTMRGLDVTCYCNKYVTQDILKIISLEKALYVVETCQAQNIPKDNCGSKLISLFLLILKIFDFIYYFIF
jgi:hypothetical protein